MNKYTQLLHASIELEGIVRVLTERESPEAHSLLNEKFQVLSNLMAQLTPAECEEPVIEELAEVAQHEEVKQQEAIEPELEPEDEAAEEAIERGEEEAHEEVSSVEVVDDDTEEPYTPPMLWEQTSMEPLRPHYSDELAEDEDEEEPVVASAPAVETPLMPEVKTEISLKKAFTVNDRFRFIRELFDGNAEDMAQTVALIESMGNLADAEDFLFNDLMWDRNNPMAAEFVEILSHHLPR